MKSYSRVTLLGNLTKDPESRSTAGGTEVTKLSLAINSKYGEKEEVSFFDIAVFGKAAEFAKEYVKKGDPLLVEGVLRQQRWEQDGQNRSRVEVIAKEIVALGMKKNNLESKSGESEEDFPL